MATTAKIIIEAVDKVTAVINDIGKQGKNLADKLKSGFSAIGDVGRDFTALGLAGVGAFGLVVKASSDFDAALNSSMTMTGLQGDAANDMKKKMATYALEMSSKFGIAGEKINEAFYNVLSTGAQAGTDAFKDLTETALDFSRVSKLSVSDSISILSTAVKIFGSEVGGASKVADILFQASALGQTNITELSEAMKTAGPVARIARISFAETAAILTTLADNGFRGAEAGTAFRQIFGRISGNKEVVDYLKTMGINVFDSAGKFRGALPVLTEMKEKLGGMSEQQRLLALRTIVGDEAISKMGALLSSDLPKIKSWTDQLSKSDGVVKKQSETIGNTFPEKMKIFAESMKNLAITIGNQLLPVLTPIVSEITKIVKAVFDWVSKNAEIAKWAVIIGGIASVLTVVTGAVMMFIGAIGGAVAGLVAGAAAIPAIISALAPFAPLILVIVAAIGAVMAAVGLLAVAWANNWGGIQEKTRIVIDYIMQAWGAFSKWIVAAWNAIWKEVGPVVQEITDFIMSAWNDVVTELTPILEDLWVLIQKGWKDFQPILEKLLIIFESQIVSFAKDTAVEMKNWLEIFKGIWAMVKILYETVIKPTFIMIGQIIKAVFDDSKTPIEKFKAVLQALVQFMSTIGRQIVLALSSAMAKEWLNFQNWYNQKFGELQGMISAMAGLTGQANNNKMNVSTPQKIVTTQAVVTAQASGSRSTAPAMSLNIGTFVGDDSGLRMLETKLNKFRLETAGRYAV